MKIMASFKEKINTQNLLDIVVNNPKKIIEAGCFINHFLIATHFVYFNGSNFSDEGIDGEKKLVHRKYFLENYKSSYWIIDNII